MMAKDEPYKTVIVESYYPLSKSGLHGDVHIRPVEGQRYPKNMHVRCSKKLSEDYKVGTKFKLQAKLTDREGGGEFLHSDYRWPFEVVSEPES